MDPDRLAALQAAQKAGLDRHRGYTDADIVAAINRGETAQTIRERFGCSQKTLWLIARKTRHSLRFDAVWDDEMIAELRELWAHGLSTAEIGLRIGVSKSAVIGKAHRLDLSARPSPIRRPLSEAQKVAIKALRRKGIPTRVIAKQTGVDRRTIQRRTEQAPPAPRVTLPKPEAPVIADAAQVEMPLRTATIVTFPEVGRCCYLSGERGNYRQCEAMAASGEHVAKPHSYCSAHRAVSYVPRRHVA